MQHSDYGFAVAEHIPEFHFFKSCATTTRCRNFPGQLEAVFFLLLFATLGLCATVDEVYTSSVVGSTAIPWGRPSTWITSRIFPSFKTATAPALTSLA